LADYKTMYLQLAAKMADAIELLTAAQQECEVQFIEYKAQGKLSLIRKETDDDADKDSR